VESSEIPEDFFMLLGPDAGLSAPTVTQKTGEIIRQGSGFTTGQDIVVYSSSEDRDLLTDHEWRTLRENGIVAVHNKTIEWYHVNNQGKGVHSTRGGANVGRYKYADRDDHHVFNKWRANPKTGVQNDAAELNSVIFGTGHFQIELQDDALNDIFGQFMAQHACDFLTIPVETTLHQGTTKFMSKSWEAKAGSLLGRLRLAEPSAIELTKKQIRREAIEHMWKMTRNELPGEQLGFPAGKVGDRSEFDLDLLPTAQYIQ
jgi:hypothetical protein